MANKQMFEKRDKTFNFCLTQSRAQLNLHPSTAKQMFLAKLIHLIITSLYSYSTILINSEFIISHEGA